MTNTNTNANTSRKATRKASPVRTVTVAPEALSGADLGAAALPPELQAAIEAGRAAVAAAARPVREVRRYVQPPAEFAAAIDSLGWKISVRVGDALEPKSTRKNITENSAIYYAIASLFDGGSEVSIWKIAALYNAIRNPENNILTVNYILQRVANVTGKNVRLVADTVTLS